MSFSKKRIREYVKSHRIRKLQIGCGGNILTDWLNTDLNPSEEVVFLDARKPFSIDDSTFDYVFCEHLIEHLEYHHGIHFLAECFRILKPGGKIRIATPDLQFLIELYNPEKTELQKKYIIWAVDTFLFRIGIHADTFVINNLFRGFGHKFIYDFKTLKNVMNRVGFINVIRCNVGESADSNLKDIEYDGKGMPPEFYKLETIVVEAMKPIL